MKPQRLEPEEFSRLYAEAFNALRVVAMGEAGPANADDVVQQAAIVGLERLERFERGTDFRAWMAAIVRGVARNQRRSDRRRAARIKAVFRASPPVEEARPLVPVLDLRLEGAPLEAAPPEEFDEDLRCALTKLEPQQRTCLLLRTVLDCTYREIGALLDIPEATARSHAHRARKRLLNVLQPKDGGTDR